MSGSVIFFTFEFEQLTTLQYPRPTVQSKPHISHNHIFNVTVKFRLTSYLISRLSAGAKFVLIGIGLPSTFSHPHSRGLI
jgi:hypothetical protein